MQNGYRQKFTRLLVRKNEKRRVVDFNTGMHREMKHIKKIPLSKLLKKNDAFVNALINLTVYISFVKEKYIRLRTF